MDDWIKAKCDTANSCVWIKARESMTEGGDQCVYVASADLLTGEGRSVPDLRPDTDVLIRDEHGNVCQFTAREWQVFRRGVKAGDFDGIAPNILEHVPQRPGQEVKASRETEPTLLGQPVSTLGLPDRPARHSGLVIEPLPRGSDAGMGATKPHPLDRRR